MGSVMLVGCVKYDTRRLPATVLDSDTSRLTIERYFFFFSIDYFVHDCSTDCDKISLGL